MKLNYETLNRNIAIFCIFVGLGMLIVIFLISPVNAAQTLNSSVNLTMVTENSLTWSVTYKNAVRATGATLDGVTIEGYDLNHNVNYTASELQSNTTHEFCIYKDLINCEKGTTKATSMQPIYDYLGIIILLFAALICLVVAALYEKMIGFAALVFGAIISGISVTGDNFIGTLLGLIVIFASIFVTFKGD